jgi:hypothetical protein
MTPYLRELLLLLLSSSSSSSLALQASAGYGLLVSLGFLITHNDAPQLVGFHWTSDQQKPLPDNTQQTNIHAPGGIQTHDRSRRAAVDLCLRLRGHWDRRLRHPMRIKIIIINYRDRKQSVIKL